MLRFQGTAPVEILTQQGSANHGGWVASSTFPTGKSASSPPVVREYDKSIKGYCYRFVDQSARLSFPAPLAKDNVSKATAIHLAHPTLIFQVLIPASGSLTIEIGLTDSGRTRRRLIFSSSLQNSQVKANPLHASASLFHSHHPDSAQPTFDKWMNLVVDVAALVRHSFHNQTLKHIDSLVISGANCRVRKVFSLNDLDINRAIQRSQTSRSDDILPRSLDYPQTTENISVYFDGRTKHQSPPHPVEMQPAPKAVKTTVRKPQTATAPSSNERGVTVNMGIKKRLNTSTESNLKPKVPCEQDSMDNVTAIMGKMETPASPKQPDKSRIPKRSIAIPVKSSKGILSKSYTKKTQSAISDTASLSGEKVDSSQQSPIISAAACEPEKDSSKSSVTNLIPTSKFTGTITSSGLYEDEGDFVNSASIKQSVAALMADYDKPEENPVEKTGPPSHPDPINFSEQQSEPEDEYEFHEDLRPEYDATKYHDDDDDDGKVDHGKQQNCQNGGEGEGDELTQSCVDANDDEVDELQKLLKGGEFLVDSATKLLDNLRKHVDTDINDD